MSEDFYCDEVLSRTPVQKVAAYMRRLEMFS